MNEVHSNESTCRKVDVLGWNKSLEKPKIRVEKRVSLAKFQLFVVPEEQDCWMYQDPSADDVKLAKDKSKKRKEIRESTVSKIQR